MRLSFLYLIPIVEKFVSQKSNLYHIDYSHNLYHSQMVKGLGFFIADRDYRLTKNQREVLYLSCMLHDMCDPKYTPVAQAILDVSNFLEKECGVSATVHDGVMNIITSMSYHQVVRPDGRVEYPQWLWKEKNYKDVYHITREADLLTSYDIKRMVHYKHEKTCLLYTLDIYNDILETAENRMCKLIERNLFVSPSAKKIATLWHHELCHQIIPKLSPDDIYPIFNQPPACVRCVLKRLQHLVD